MARIDAPPRLAQLLLRCLLPREEREIIAGDLEELFARMVRDGRRDAGRRYWSAALSSVVARRRRWRSRGGGWSTDLRVALRRIRAEPWFTVLAALTLALGIGANTAVFSVLDEALLRPMPGVAEPEGLGIVEFVERADGDRRIGLLPAEVEGLRSGVRRIDGVAAFALLGLHASLPGGTPEAVNGQTVLGDYFELLGVRPAAGRLPGAAEMAVRGDPNTIVISDRLWAALFDRDPGAVGRVLHVNRSEMQVVGVTAAGFRGVSQGYDVDAWVPASALPLLFDARGADGARAPATERMQYFMQAVVRFGRGVDATTAQADLTRAFENMASSASRARALAGHVPRLHPGIGLEPSMRARAVSSARLLLGVVGLVLIIACANVANLLLFRSVRRRGEVAVRRALGASTLRLMRLHLTESALLAAIAGAAGLFVGWLVATVLRGSPLIGGREFTGFTLDARVLAFTCVVAMSTVLLSGLLPALLAGGRGEQTTLREASSRTTQGKGRLRSGMTVLQLGLSLALVVCALLVTRAVRNLHAVDLGFDPERIWTARLYFTAQGMSAADAKVLTDRVLAMLRATPQVEAAGAVTSAPFWGLTDAVRLIHPSGADTVNVVREGVTPGYLETLGVTVEQGRLFSEGDVESSGEPIVVTRSLARRLFGAGPAAGRTLLAIGREGPRELTVIGVTGDMRTVRPAQEPDEAAYRISRGEPVQLMITVRLREDARDPAGLIRAVIAEAAPQMPRATPVPLTDALNARIGAQLLLARLLGLISILAVSLAAVGLYAVIAAAVAERKQEIGIRMALGARSAGVARLVLRRVTRTLAAGILAGLAGALVLTRFVEGYLFGVTALEPSFYAAGALLFAAIGVLATVPSLRAATRIEPLSILRES